MSSPGSLRDAFLDLLTIFGVILLFASPFIVASLLPKEEQPKISTTKVELCDTGAAFIYVSNEGGAPDTLEGVLLVYRGKIVSGRIVNTTEPLRYGPNVEIPPKSSGWVVVQFDVETQIEGDAVIKVAFAESGIVTTQVKTLPCSRSALCITP